MLRRTLAGLTASLAIAAGTTSTLAQVGTAFTYQGQLTDTGAVVSTPMDMQFSLWTLGVGGTQVGSTVTQLNVAVDQGLFTTTVDFGVSPYATNQALYLQMAVAPAGTGSYESLGSRQKLTASPFSLATRGINVDSAGRVGIGVTSPSSPFKLDVNGRVFCRAESNGISGGIEASDNDSPSTSRAFIGRGTPAERHTGFWANGLGWAMVVKDNGKVGIGNLAPGSTLDVVGDGPIVGGTSAARAIRAQSHQTWGSAIGVDASNLEGGKMWDLFATGGVAGEGQGKFIIRNDTNGMNVVTIMPNGAVGIGTTEPAVGKLLHVAGDVTAGDLTVGSLDASGNIALRTGPYPKILMQTSGPGSFDGTAILYRNDTSRAVHLGGSSGASVVGVYNNSVGNVISGYFIHSVNTDATSLVVAGVKSFVEPNPSDPTTDIYYACMEGPEAGMYTRGTATLVNGHAVISLPGHFTDLAASQGMTVMLTPLSGDSMGLAVIGKNNTGFEVMELMRGQGNYQFDWEVKAVRAKHLDYQVTRPWTDRVIQDEKVSEAQVWQSRLQEMAASKAHTEMLIQSHGQAR